MKDLRIITVAALLLLSRTALVYAQGAGIEWDVLNQEAIDLYRQGKYDRAVVVAQKALEVAKQNVGPDHPDVATSLNNLALLYYARSDYAKAVPLYKRSLVITVKSLGPDHPDVATGLENLAALYRATKRNEAAGKLERRATKIRAMKR